VDVVESAEIVGESNNDGASRVKLTARDSGKVESNTSKPKPSRVSKGRGGPEKN
jgi:hypothetical protein